MFTGIIKEVGVVRGNIKQGGAYRLTVEAGGAPSRVAIGDSVSVSGVCLTVVAKDKDTISFDMMEKTAATSTLKELSKGDPVNLEESLKPSDAMGGHFVLGHVDCAGRISDIGKDGGNVFFKIDFPDRYSRLVVEKGSVAIDGISLTLSDVSDSSFKVNLIPHTLSVTTLGWKNKGDKVNIEFDIIGKYVSRSSNRDSGTRIDEEFLKKNGWT